MKKFIGAFDSHFKKSELSPKKDLLDSKVQSLKTSSCKSSYNFDRISQLTQEPDPTSSEATSQETATFSADKSYPSYDSRETFGEPTEHKIERLQKK